MFVVRLLKKVGLAKLEHRCLSNR